MALEASNIAVVAQATTVTSFLGGLEESAVRVAVVEVSLARSPRLLSAILERSPPPRLLMLGVGAAEAERWRRSGASGYLDSSIADCSSFVSAIRTVALGKAAFAEWSGEAPVPAPHQVPGFNQLSARETEVLTHLASGRVNHRIAEVLGISDRTVKAHVASLYRKLELENRTQLAVLAQRLLLGDSIWQTAAPAGARR